MQTLMQQDMVTLCVDLLQKIVAEDIRCYIENISALTHSQGMITSIIFILITLLPITMKLS